MTTLKINSNGTPKGKWFFLALDKLSELNMTTNDVDTIIIDGIKFRWETTIQRGDVKINSLTMIW